MPDTNPNLTVTQRATSYVVAVRHDCGHVYRSECAWNTAPAAETHGRTLANLACSACRDARS